MTILAVDIGTTAMKLGVYRAAGGHPAPLEQAAIHPLPFIQHRPGQSPEDAFRAKIVHVNRAGPTVKLELRAERGDPVFVDVPEERFAALGLAEGAEGFIRPLETRVFAERER